MVARGPGGTRTIAAADFFVGLFTSALAQDEVLTEIRVPKTSAGWSYLKFHRRAQDWALVGVAAVRMNGGAHVALTNMGEKPIRAAGWRRRSRAARTGDRGERADEGRPRPRTAFGERSTAGSCRRCWCGGPSRRRSRRTSRVGPRLGATAPRVRLLSWRRSRARFDAPTTSGSTRKPFLAFAVAVIKRFGEDRASQLAALIAYYGFFSLFPLLLALVTLAGCS